MSECVLDAYSLDVHPLCWRRKFRRIAPDELLTQLEVSLLEKGQECLEGQGGHDGLARLPSIPHFKHDRPIRAEQIDKFRCERRQPINIILAIEISVPFLRVQWKRGRREH